MKVLNIMNFVRELDPRIENSHQILFNTTSSQLALVNEFGYENTFLLQYDALIDPHYQKLFKEKADSRTELGLWLEIAEPLTNACNIPWRGRLGWPWDWHVVPGFSMAYTTKQREIIIDECMQKFLEVFGFYPKTVASWLLDSHTVNYLNDKYHISTLAICRDQVNTDAYTLIGGYFNGAYFPSRNNLFTPAQTENYRLPVPLFRLLGPDPVHNYDNEKYLYGADSVYYKVGQEYRGCYTMEPVWPCGRNSEVYDWFIDTFYSNEDLGFSYSQIGQENSFGYIDFLPYLRMQFEKIRTRSDIHIMKMCDTGEAFRELYPHGTPATAVCALSDWNRPKEVQSIYYNCASYTANLFREQNHIFIRSFYLFDERVSEYYLDSPCETWDALYENLPIIDTKDTKNHGGLCITTKGTAFTVERKDTALLVKWDSGGVMFTPNNINIFASTLSADVSCFKAMQKKSNSKISFCFKGTSYYLSTNANISQIGNTIKLTTKSSTITLTPEGQNIVNLEGCNKNKQ